MDIIKIEPRESGAHDNRHTPWEAAVPDGWAKIPEGVACPDSYPFVRLTVEVLDGVPTVTAMEAMDRPEREPEKAPPTVEEQLAALQTAQEDTDALLVDQEYRLTLLELGITE